jgi:hypothetical protein
LNRGVKGMVHSWTTLTGLTDSVTDDPPWPSCKRWHRCGTPTNRRWFSWRNHWVSTVFCMFTPGSLRVTDLLIFCSTAWLRRWEPGDRIRRRTCRVFF